MKKNKNCVVKENSNCGKNRKRGVSVFIKDIMQNPASYLLMFPAVLYAFIFSYLSYPYLLIAFRNYKLASGPFGDKWVGFKNFEFFFRSSNAFVTTANTLKLNLLFIFWGTLAAMVIALLFNEIRSSKFIKVTQSFILLPHYLSWVVIGFMLYSIFSMDLGVLNNIGKAFHMEPVNWYAKPEAWPAILTIMKTWKTMGLNAVIYMAAMTSIDGTLYEAAVIDGAGKWKQCLYITIPLIMPTVCMLTIMNIGKIFYGDFGMIYALIGDNGVLYPTTDVIDTYVFRALRTSGNTSQTMAIGLYQSVMGFIMVFAANRITKKYFEDGALF